MSVSPSNNLSLLLSYVKDWTFHTFWDFKAPINFENDLDIKGEIAIVTGSNSGIGKEAARELARRGAVVIMACRNIAKAESAAEDIRKTVPNPNLVMMELDLADMSSIRAFVDDFKRKYDKLHIIVNNAGYMFTEPILQKTKDGFEQHMGVNHLGPFLLTRLLLDTLKATENSRIISVASSELTLAKLDLDDLMMEKKIKTGNFGLEPYDISKLANALCTRRLAKVELANSHVKVYQMCPGLVRTNLFDSGDGIFSTMRRMGTHVFALQAQKGCETIIYCAVSKELSTNPDSGKGEMYRFRKCYTGATAFLNPDDPKAVKLYEMSEKFTNLV